MLDLHFLEGTKKKKKKPIDPFHTSKINLFNHFVLQN